MSVAAAAVPVRRQRLDLRGQRGVGQTRADALGDIESGGPARHVFDAAVGQFHMNSFSHDRACSRAFSHVRSILVVITGLEEINSRFRHPVNQPMFLRDAARPAACQLECFNGSGLPIPSNGSRMTASTSSSIHSATLRSVFAQYSRSSRNFGWKTASRLACRVQSDLPPQLAQ